jgi:hypothetical protein
MAQASQAQTMFRFASSNRWRCWEARSAQQSSHRSRALSESPALARRRRVAKGVAPRLVARAPRSSRDSCVIVEKLEAPAASFSYESLRAPRSVSSRLESAALTQTLPQRGEDRRHRNFIHRSAFLLRRKRRLRPCPQNRRSGMARTPMVGVCRPEKRQRRRLHRVGQVDRGGVNAAEQSRAFDESGKRRQAGPA